MLLKKSGVLGSVFGILVLSVLELNHIVEIAFNLSTLLMHLLGWRQ